MRVFYISARGDSFGGASLHVRDMARRLIDDGHEAKIAVGGTSDMEVPKRFAEKDLDFVCIPEMGRSINPVKDLIAVSKLRKEFKAFAPDLISTHASKGGALGRVAALGTGIPVIYTPHCWSFVEGFNHGWMYRAAEKLFAPLASRIVAVCEDEREFGLSKGVGRDDKTICIHNGVMDVPNPPGNQMPTPGATVRILMVGRFEEQKDHPLLLRALADLKDLNWELKFVGAGPRLDECTALTKELGISDRVTFAGYSASVEDHLADADIFTLISNWEGFPRSILEALRSGLPVIASDVGGSRESVIDGVNGNIVPKGDLETLRTTLRRQISDAKLRAKMGQNGREIFSDKFTFDRMFSRYLDLYQSLAA